jgi:D-serine deaminase-like pyridoxal phosphate-dependent protein
MRTPTSIYDLVTPAILIDHGILERNLTRMQDRANSLGVTLRPHIKTHKCIEIANHQLELGARGITVSTVYELEQFVAAGFNDITWAFPLVPAHVDRVVELNEKATIRLVIDGMEMIDRLEAIERQGRERFHVWLKVDCGYHRAGVDPKSPFAEQLVRVLNDCRNIIFDGLLTHAGHSYEARNRDEVFAVAEQERNTMVEFAERMRSRGYKVPMISLGSTPTMSVVENLDGVSEMRPGNYAFYDYTQVMLGTCGVSDCAVSVMATVVSHQPGAPYFITDSGEIGRASCRERVYVQV